MVFQNIPVDKLNKKQLTTISLALEDIKHQSKNRLTSNKETVIYIEKKLGNRIKNLYIPDDMQLVAEQGHLEALYYLVRQGAIKEVVVANGKEKYDYAVTLVSDNFSKFYDKVMMLTIPYQESILRQVNSGNFQQPNNSNLHDTTQIRLPNIKFNVGNDFAVHKNNIISYKGNEIPLEHQVARFIAFIMKRSRNNYFTTTEMLVDKFLSDERYGQPEKYVIKIISEARKEFKTATKTDINFFPNKRSFGYTFRY